jgi:hypothetical protein
MCTVQTAQCCHHKCKAVPIDSRTKMTVQVRDFFLKFTGIYVRCELDKQMYFVRF